MALIRLTLALVCTLSIASQASAAPLTLNFAGQWQHYDPQSDAPAFWADMASLGIVNGTLALFTFSVDDTATGSNPANGVFAVTSWQLRLGQYTFTNTAQPYSLSVTGFSGTSAGPTLLGTYSPGFMQFGLGSSGLPVFGGLSGLANAQWPNTLLYFDFISASSRNAGIMNLTRSVPGSGALPIALSGVACLLWRLRRSRVGMRDPNAS